VASADDPLGRLTAGYSPARSAVILALTLAGLAAVGWRHAVDVEHHDALAWTWAALSLLMGVIQLLAWLDRPKRVTAAEALALDLLRVTVNVPVYNEDPEALKLVALALARQTRPAQRVEFVDDGSDQFGYGDVRAGLARLSLEHPATEWLWIRTERGPESGKRAAQAVTIRGDGRADIFATIDSDTILDPCAIEEGLKPFADTRVQSVAAVLLVFNARRNLLTALTDIWLAVYQLGIRAAWSRLGRVMVNSGGLAFYRAQLVRDALPAYLGETFAGRRVSYSDDAMLTFFAALRGRTVQQPTCFAFTIMPERPGHHIRQCLRWMRGNVIRSFWRFRYLSPLQPGWWLAWLAWAEFTVTTVLLITVAVPVAVVAVRHPGALPAFTLPDLPVLAGLSYLVSLRAMLVRRADQPTAFRLAAFAGSPLITLWSMTVLRALRLWAIITCTRGGWGTRQKVEVELSP
jgi:hyaluronan synthase